MRLDLPKTTAEFACLDAVRAGNSGNVLGDDSDKQHRLMQHLVVLEVAQQGHGHVFYLRREKDCSARDAGLRGFFTGGKEGSEWYCLARQLRRHQSAPRAPGGHDRENDETDHQREPAAARDLQCICHE